MTLTFGRFLGVCFLCFMAFCGGAQQGSAQTIEAGPDSRLEDAQLEARARAISKNLRCPTCVSQSVDSSNVGISQDLKILVRERLVAGDSDQQIYEYIALRYGDFVLLKPRYSLANSVLWISPLILLLGVGGYLIARTMKKKQHLIKNVATIEANNIPLSDDEEQELSTLLAQNSLSK